MARPTLQQAQRGLHLCKPSYAMTSANGLLVVLLILNPMGNVSMTCAPSDQTVMSMERLPESTTTDARSMQEPNAYHHSSPTFSCTIPSEWVEYSKAPTLGVYAKFWRVVDGTFTGSGIRITGGPAGYVTSTWEINTNELKIGFEKEYIVRNYRTDKITINGRKAMRFEFDSQLTEKGKTIPIKMIGHTFLVKENGNNYLIMVMLLSRVYEITADNAGYMAVVNSLKFH